MITMYSDYNPEAAGELLEQDCIEMLRAGLFLAGFDSADLQEYNDFSNQLVCAYQRALGDADENGVHSEEQYAAAVAAANPHRKDMEYMLWEMGVTIDNELKQPDDEGRHATIHTTVYTNRNNKIDRSDVIAALIIRPITDTEAATYVNNTTGYRNIVTPEHMRNERTKGEFIQ